MTPLQKYNYEQLARKAISGADMELVEVVPENDYIEAWCPRCEKISVFTESDLNHVYCATCDNKRSRDYFFRKCEELVQSAGFNLLEASYEDDFIEISCPLCLSNSAFSFSELGKIYCKMCTMEDAAFENGFDLFVNESFGKKWAPDVEQWYAENNTRPAVIVCRACGEVYIFDADAPDAIEQIKHRKCKCRV